MSFLRGVQFFKTMSSAFFQGGEKFSEGGFSSLATGLVAVTALSIKYRTE